MPESTTEVLHSLPFPHLLDEMLQFSKSYNKTIMEINQKIDAAEEARQKEYKRIKDAMKADIKQQSKRQILTKPDRKTVNHSGTRTYKAPTAQQAVHLNGVYLRHLFIAYAIFRMQGGRIRNIPEVQYTFGTGSGTIIRKDGKAITSAENAPRIELVTKILEKYGTSIKLSKTVHLNKREQI